jgi:hypothetical protein
MTSIAVIEMSGRNETETDQTVAHLRFEVVTEVVHLIQTIVIEEVVEGEDVVIFKAMRSRGVNRGPSVLESQMVNHSRTLGAFTGVVKVVSDTALLVTMLCLSIDEICGG